MSESIKLPRYSVGIDCGENTGLSFYDRAAKKLISVHTTDFFGVALLLSAFFQDEMHVYVEIPPTFIYSRNDHQSGAVRDKQAVNIGGNRREAQLLAEDLRRKGYAVSEVPPIRQTKWTQEQFEKEMQTQIKTNQHCRDAARIAFRYAGKIV